VGVAASSNVAMAANHMIPQQAGGSEVVDLINHTASAVVLDDLGEVTIMPGEQRSFVVAAGVSGKRQSANNKHLFISDVLSTDKLAITSSYPEFNGTFSVAEFAPQVV